MTEKRGKNSLKDESNTNILYKSKMRQVIFFYRYLTCIFINKLHFIKFAPITDWVEIEIICRK
jgi:hypothetical protein